MVLIPDNERTHEQVVGVGVGTADLEQLHQVVELAVYITAHCNGAFLYSCKPRITHNAVMAQSLTTGCTFDSSWRTSRAYSSIACQHDIMKPALSNVSPTLSHNLCTSLSASCLQLIKLSIQPSSVGMVVGSVAGTDDICIGSVLTSSMLVSMLRFA